MLLGEESIEIKFGLVELAYNRALNTLQDRVPSVSNQRPFQQVPLTLMIVNQSVTVVAPDGQGGSWPGRSPVMDVGPSCPWTQWHPSLSIVNKHVQLLAPTKLLRGFCSGDRANRIHSLPLSGKNYTVSLPDGRPHPAFDPICLCSLRICESCPRWISNKGNLI